MVLACGACAAPDERPRALNITDNNIYSRTLAERGENYAALEQILRQDRPWWEYYQDAELNALIRQALADNPDINQTRARLEQAAASAKVSFADLLPDAILSGARTTSRGDDDSPSSFSLRGAAGYELDLWGGNKASYRADTLSAQAAAQDVKTAAITLSASLVENWLRLLSLREEEALLRRQIETNQMVLDLQHKRYANGAAQALDVLQQTQVMERAKALLPDILAEQEITTHTIALLAGRSPAEGVAFTRTRLPDALPVPQTGVPAALLRGRPDINAAWLRVRSADWAAESARVDRLPNFDISADLSTASTAFQNLFSTWALDLALNLVMPLFDGGQRAAEQARQEALADERFQNYRSVVLSSIGEVEDALSRNYHQSDKITAIERQLDVSRNALEQATLSYGNGNSDYISVLNGLISVQSLELDLVRARRDLALYRVQLCRALGLQPVAGGMNG